MISVFPALNLKLAKIVTSQTIGLKNFGNTNQLCVFVFLCD